MRAPSALVLVACGLLGTPPTTPQEGAAPSLEELERVEATQAFDNAVEGAKAALENLVNNRRLGCLRAFGSRGFCECLSNSLPVSVPFEGYVSIITKKREALDYANLDLQSRKVVDMTYAAREKCVAAFVRKE